LTTKAKYFFLNIYLILFYFKHLQSFSMSLVNDNNPVCVSQNNSFISEYSRPILVSQLLTLMTNLKLLSLGFIWINPNL